MAVFRNLQCDPLLTSTAVSCCIQVNRFVGKMTHSTKVIGGKLWALTTNSFLVCLKWYLSRHTEKKLCVLAQILLCITKGYLRKM